MSMVAKLREALPFPRAKEPDSPAAHLEPAARLRLSDPGHPLVHPLVLDGTHFSWTETPMPPSVLAHCRAQNAYFHGLCGNVVGTRLTVRGAALRGLEHAVSRTEGRDAVGATWDGRHAALYLAVADGRGLAGDPPDAARRAVYRVLQLTADGALDASAEPFHRRKGATTVMAAIVRPQPKGATVQVLGGGDLHGGGCEAWLLTPGGWHALRPERTGGYPVPPGSVVVIGTDGVTGALGQNSHLAAELSARWRRPPTPLEFLAQLDFYDGYRTGDRAAAAVWIG